MNTVAKRKLIYFFEILTEILGLLSISIGIFYFTIEPFVALFAFILSGVVLLIASIFLRARGRSLSQEVG